MLGTVWLLITATVLAVVHMLRPVYRSEALLQIEWPRIPERVLGLPADAGLWTRFGMARLRVLSHSQLLLIMREMDLYPGQRRTPAEVEESVGRLRRRINIAALQSKDSRLGTIRITCEGPDPASAAALANRVAVALRDELQRTRELEAKTTLELISSRLADAKEKLETCEGALKDFLVEHDGELPQQEKALSAELSRLEAELAAAYRSILQSQQNKAQLERALAAARAAEPAADRAAAPSARAVRTEKPPDNALRKRLAVLLARYKEEHPDVRRLRSELAVVESLEKAASGQAEIDPEANGAPVAPQDAGAPASPAAPNKPERVERLVSQLAEANQQLTNLSAQRSRLSQAADSLRSRLEKVPFRQQQWAALTREYGHAEADHRALARQQQSAEMVVGLRRREAEQLVMLEKAQVPLRPVASTRVLLCLLGAVGGYLLSAAAVLAWEAGPRAILVALTAAGGAQNAFPRGYPFRKPVVSRLTRQRLDRRAAG